MFFKPKTFHTFALVSLILCVGFFVVTLFDSFLGGIQFWFLLGGIVLFFTNMFFASALDLLTKIRNSNKRIRELMEAQMEGKPLEPQAENMEE